MGHHVTVSVTEEQRVRCGLLCFVGLGFNVGFYVCQHYLEVVQGYFCQDIIAAILYFS